MSRYEMRTSSGDLRPNITSSFEYPKENVSLLSMRRRSNESPNSSDKRADSSRPPNPAPRTITRSFNESSFEDILNHHEFCAVPECHERNLGVVVIDAYARGDIPVLRAEVHQLACLSGVPGIESWKRTSQLLSFPGRVVDLPNAISRVEDIKRPETRDGKSPIRYRQFSPRTLRRIVQKIR